MPSEPQFESTFTVADAAKILGYERTTIYRLIWKDKIQVVSGCARLRIPKAELVRFLGRVETYTERTAHSRRSGANPTTSPCGGNN